MRFNRDKLYKNNKIAMIYKKRDLGNLEIRLCSGYNLDSLPSQFLYFVVYFNSVSGNVRIESYSSLECAESDYNNYGKKSGSANVPDDILLQRF